MKLNITHYIDFAICFIMLICGLTLMIAYAVFPQEYKWLGLIFSVNGLIVVFTAIYIFIITLRSIEMENKQ